MAFTNINKPSDYFNTVTYAGTSATNNITVGFQPDFVWIKNRTNALAHYLNDSVRGVHKILFSNLTNAEFDGTSGNDGVSAFTSTGFTLLNGTNYENYNATSNNYASWNWLASNTTASNTDGSITSTVSANTTSGFSVVSYSGSSSLSTVGHGLSSAPEMMIIKTRTSSYEWGVYHKDLAANYNLYLNTTAAAAESDVGDLWNSTAPTSSVFTVNGNDIYVNYSGQDYIAYCFHSVKGYSKIGSYTGNGSTDGPMVYTGFKPAFVLLKNTDNGTRSWYTFDNKRNIFNATISYLLPNLSNAEADTSTGLDFLSNGFKIRESVTGFNESGSAFIYMAFAESPFTTSTGIPTTAR